jgi:hypothetical protein
MDGRGHLDPDEVERGHGGSGSWIGPEVHRAEQRQGEDRYSSFSPK